jgi:hypothetical protein
MHKSTEYQGNIGEIVDDILYHTLAVISWI